MDQSSKETPERMEAQRDEARLRVNVMALCVGNPQVYPVPQVHAALWLELQKALAPK
jgi:hypothetical protein